MWQIQQLQERLGGLAPFSGGDMCAVVVGSWGLERPNFQILVLVEGEAAKANSLSQRHQWLTQLLETTRSLGMGLSWQDVRFIHPSDLTEPNLTGRLGSTVALDRPIPDALLLLVDGIALTNPNLLQAGRSQLLKHHFSNPSESQTEMPFLGLAHAIQECWHRLCLHSAVHAEMERLQFGWRLALQSLVISLVHLKPANSKEVLAHCERPALARIAHLLHQPSFDATWAEEHQLFLEDFQALMELRSIKTGSTPVAMSQLTQRRYNRFFYRLLTHPNVDEALRFTLLS